MDSERVTAIRVQVEQGYYVESDEGYLFEDEQASKDIDYLLAELAKLQAVVEAAREIVADAIADDELVNWAVVILQSVLAAYEAGEGE